MDPNVGVAVFTAIELVTLVLWLVLAGVPVGTHYAAIVLLAAGLFAEHVVSFNVGTGQPFFRFPLQRAGGSS
jgi:hypothetical protein